MGWDGIGLDWMEGDEIELNWIGLSGMKWD